VTVGLLSTVLQRTQTHSISEERLIRLSDFPEYEHHLCKHNQLVERVQTMLCTYQSGHRSRVADQLNAFADALNGHVSEDHAALQCHLLRFCPGRSGY
jgi:hemerythrin